MTSLITSASLGFTLGPLYWMFTVVVLSGIGLPFRSLEMNVSTFNPGPSATRTENVFTLVHLTGYSIPLIQMVFTSTGAVPLRATRLLLTTNDDGPLMAKG